MASITKGYTFGATEQVTAVKLHTLVDSATLGTISNGDIATDAAIAATKLAKISAAGKLSGVAFTELDSIPSIAGVIPSANIPAAATVESIKVGGLYIEVLGVNPATTLGYGTWVAFGAGKVPVGLDSGDIDFATAEGTGGEKTHTLTIPEMPAHTHSWYVANGEGVFQTDTGGGTGGAYLKYTRSTGGDGAHNNVQPYIVVHMWKRTA